VVAAVNIGVTRVVGGREFKVEAEILVVVSVASVQDAVCPRRPTPELIFIAFKITALMANKKID
jgi:hypothetical protein